MIARRISLFCVFLGLYLFASVFSPTFAFQYLMNIAGKGVDPSVPLPSNIKVGKVNLLTTYFGRYPCIGCGRNKSSWCNGGLPQLANYNLHRAKIEEDIKSAVPDSNFSGYIVLDYEAWTLPWERAGDVYKNASIALASSLLPANATVTDVEKKARDDYNRASLEFMIFTTKTTKSLRPYASVGFYGYPHHSYWGSMKNESEWNDKLGSLWEAVSFLAPSIYLPYSTKPPCTGAGCASVQNQQRWIDGGINESVRISAKTEHRLEILPYSWYRYHDGEPKGLEFLSYVDAHLEFVRPFEVGSGKGIIQNMILWGNEGNESDFNDTLAFLSRNSDIFGAVSSARENAEHSVEFAPTRLSASRRREFNMNNSGNKSGKMLLNPIESPIPTFQVCNL